MIPVISMTIPTRGETLLAIMDLMGGETSDESDMDFKDLGEAMVMSSP